MPNTNSSSECLWTVYGLTRPSRASSSLLNALFLRACHDSNVWEVTELDLQSSFLTRIATTRFNNNPSESTGHVLGQAVSYLPKTNQWLLVNSADSNTLNLAVSSVTWASLAVREVPCFFGAGLRDPGEACGNVYSDEQLNIAFIQGLWLHLQVDAQQYNLQFTEHTL